MFCPKCGINLPKEAIYCTECGRKIVTSSSVLETNIEASSSGVKKKSKNKKSKRKGNILIVLFVAFILALCVLLVKMFIASQHEHVWSEATCTVPMQCIECGEFAGNSLGHEWQDATCTTAMNCSICGEINGEIGGHNWEEASCNSSKTCRTCGIIEGKSLEHELEDGKCILCGKQMDKITEENFTWEVDWIGTTDAKITVTPNSGYRFSEGAFVTFQLSCDVREAPAFWSHNGYGVNVDIDENGAPTSILFSEQRDELNDREKKLTGEICITYIKGYIIADR